MRGHIRTFSDIDPNILSKIFDTNHEELRENASQLQERQQRNLAQRAQDVSLKALGSAPQSRSNCSLLEHSPITILPYAMT